MSFLLKNKLFFVSSDFSQSPERVKLGRWLVITFVYINNVSVQSLRLILIYIQSITVWVFKRFLFLTKQIGIHKVWCEISIIDHCFYSSLNWSDYNSNVSVFPSNGSSHPIHHAGWNDSCSGPLSVSHWWHSVPAAPITSIHSYCHFSRCQYNQLTSSNSQSNASCNFTGEKMKTSAGFNRAAYFANFIAKYRMLLYIKCSTINQIMSAKLSTTKKTEPPHSMNRTL